VLNPLPSSYSKVVAQTKEPGAALILFVAAALIVAITGAAPAPAEVVESGQIRQGLFSTCFISEKEGWAVGDLGRIFHTTDGAKTWELQSAGTKRPFVATACTDANHVWIAGQAGQLAHSNDGGKTWINQESGTDRQILSMQFIDAQNGFAVGDFGTMLRTEDGGATWTKIAVPADLQLPEDMIGIVEPGDIVLYAVSYADAQHLTVVGEFGVILVSQDGGRTFESRISNIEFTLFGVFMGEQGKGWAVGLEAVMLSTSDGGATWKHEQVKTPPGFSLALYDIEVRGNIGWAIGNSGYLLNTTDGGTTWNLVDVPPQMGSYWFREVSLLPGGKGYIVGSTGLILTVDGTKFTASKEQL
jgi:photosystem II stability/assembly factor-like uncharacterized protein